MVNRGHNVTGQISQVSGPQFCNRLHLCALFKEFCSFAKLSGTVDMHKIKHVSEMSWDWVSLPYHILIKIDSQRDLQMCASRVQ